MLRLTIGLFLFAVLFAVLGFGGIAGTLAGAAEIAFYAFIVLAIFSLAAQLVRGATA